MPRDKQRRCYQIESRDECLTTRGRPSGTNATDCTWCLTRCPGGYACAQRNVMEYRKLKEGQDFETCLKAKTSDTCLKEKTPVAPGQLSMIYECNQECRELHPFDIFGGSNQPTDYTECMLECLGISKVCKPRDKEWRCDYIRSRNECLTAKDSRSNYKNQDCVWCLTECPDDNVCAPRGVLDGQGKQKGEDYETCLKEGDVDISKPKKPRKLILDHYVL